MYSSDDASFPVLGAIFDILGTLCNFVVGFALGLAAPLAAIAAIVAGIRYLTGQVPYVGEFADHPEGGRRVSLQLMSTDEAKVAFDGHKEQIGGDIVKMKEEIQLIIQEAKLDSESAAEGEPAMPEPPEMVETPEVPETSEEA
jgi:hypothetical protein